MAGEGQPSGNPASARVWRVELDLPADAEADLRGALSTAEIARAERLVNPRDGSRRVVAWGTLRVLLGHALGQPPDSIQLEPGPFGKPRAAVPGTAVSFNLSHSGNLALICIAPGGEVGVDVESRRGVTSAVPIARRRFTAAEASFVERGEPADADRRFLLCWTRKEALVKALGVGLSLDLDGFTVPLSAAGGVTSVEDPAGGPRRSWLLVDVPAGDGYVAALALPAPASDGPSGVAPSGVAAWSADLDHCEEIELAPLVASAISSSPV